ncbi:MAG: glutaredoxin [Bacteroidota bacterium]
MKLHPNELTLIYDPLSITGRKLRPLAYSLTKNVNEIDCKKHKLSTTTWKEIVQMLGNNPKQLLNKSHPQYKKKVQGHTYTMDGWMNILMNTPELLRCPIAIAGGKAIYCETPNDLLKLGIATNTPEKKMPHLIRRQV